ncbi:MAG: MBL fold metallo-hydrolase [Bacteroidales bacterium]|nr:MBL fold metallo-hydrolase [Bacteroidales bacterium]MCF8387557.1 MBL fold metallo-hydrolase [Bacteroidales bacterium]MCF8399583.1 MBL fold metallo-hydrolase [Bacteroidales bacterium]
MITIKRFVFNPFQVNTYLLYDDTNECVIIDPGCYDEYEEEQLKDFISEKELKPVRLLNTHSHVDHILGNNFITATYGLKPVIHAAGLAFHKAAPQHGEAFGISIPQQQDPERYIAEGEKIHFGKSILEVLDAPGHVDGHVCFMNRDQKFLIVGDVIFQMSIGRTDLPSGNMDLLLNNIREKILTLPDDYILYPGHGPETTVGFERKNNPFLG